MGHYANTQNKFYKIDNKEKSFQNKQMIEKYSENKKIDNLEAV